MNLVILLAIPLLTSVALLFPRSGNGVKWISLAGAATQFILAFILLFSYRETRAAGNTDQMLFQQNFSWFSPFHINFHVGADGISVAMILLTAFVVLAGVLVSWNIQKMTKEFYFLLIILSLGAYGFFV